MNKKRFLSVLVGVLLCFSLSLHPGCSSHVAKEVSSKGGSSELPTPAALAGTEWLLEDLGGAGVLDDAQATLGFSKEFAADGRISGNGSCNRFSGTATVDSGRIKVGPLAATRMACVPAVDDQETRYLKALQGATRIVFDGPYLFLYSIEIEKPLRFTRRSGG